MRTAKLKDITLTITDGKHGDCKNHDGSGYYFISCKDVYDETIHYENARQIAEDDFRDADRRTNLAAYDILITNSGTIGRMALVKDIPETRKTTFQKSVAIVRADTSQVVPNYLYYLLKSKVHDFINSSNGSAQKNLLLSTMRDFDISFVDSFETQYRIATILSRYDSLIENYQKQIKLLEEAAQRLYKEWFVDLHFPGHENTNIIDGVPEGWEKKTIADVCTNISSGSTPSRSNKAYWENGTIKWVKTKELQDGWILDTEEYISQEGYNSSSTKMFPVNTILMAIYASPTLGRLGILSTDCCCNQAALGLIADENIISWQWLFWKLYELRDEFNAIARGAGQQNISGIVVKNKEIIIPDKGVIDGFTSVVSKMFEQQKSLSSQLRLLTEARDRLLPKLMSGEITV